MFGTNWIQIDVSKPNPAINLSDVFDYFDQIHILLNVRKGNSHISFFHRIG